MKLEQTGGADCSVSKGPLGVLIRKDKNSFTTGENLPWWEVEEEVKKAVADGGAKEIEDFYIIYLGPQAPCSANKDLEALQTDNLMKVKEAIKSLEILHGK